MRKIPPDLENPLDVVFVSLSDIMSPSFHSMGFSPNGITALSGLTGLAAVGLLYRGNVWPSMVLFLVSYFFDCFDGFYARKYNMVTDTGDMFDHVKDVIVYVSLVGVAICRNRRKQFDAKTKGAFAMVVATLIGSYVQLGCQEVYHNQRDASKALKFMQVPVSTKDEATQCMQVSRFFGTGSFTLATIIAIVAAEYLPEKVKDKLAQPNIIKLEPAPLVEPLVEPAPLVEPLVEPAADPLVEPLMEPAADPTPPPE